MLSSVRIRFIRGEDVKYISHLDLMKVFERAIRRARLPIAYSQGFNPHPQMVFGLPLSVGVTSEAEYADFDLAADINPEFFMVRLNDELPAGLQIVDIGVKETKSNIMASVVKASYDILVSSNEKPEMNVIDDSINGFLSQTVFTVKKESKSGTRDVDIRPMIHGLEAKSVSCNRLEVNGPVNSVDNNYGKCCTNIWLQEYVSRLFYVETRGLDYKPENIFCLSALLSAGSAANLKPELLISALDDFAGLGLKIAKIHRTGLYVTKGDRALEPLDAAVLTA